MLARAHGGVQVEARAYAMMARVAATWGETRTARGLVRRALACLEQGPDAVVGPAEDGGYVLLGLKLVAPELFQDMPWGTDGVLSKTRQRLRGLAWDWRELPELWDVDDPQDLERLTAFSGLGEWGGPASR